MEGHAIRNVLFKMQFTPVTPFKIINFLQLLIKAANEFAGEEGVWVWVEISHIFLSIVVH